MSSAKALDMFTFLQEMYKLGTDWTEVRGMSVEDVQKVVLVDCDE